MGPTVDELYHGSVMSGTSQSASPVLSSGGLGLIRGLGYWGRGLRGRGSSILVLFLGLTVLWLMGKKLYSEEDEREGKKEYGGGRRREGYKERGKRERREGYKE